MTLDWDSLDAGKYRDETETVTELVARSRFSADERASIREEAETLVADARYVARRHGVLESFLQEFSLSTPAKRALSASASAWVKRGPVSMMSRALLAILEFRVA